MFERMHGPLGPRRDDYLAAIVAMTVRNSQAHKKQHVRPLTDFLPDWNPPQPVDEEGAFADGQHP